MNPCPQISDKDLNHVLQHVSAWDDLRGARIFITGGTGFFGSWLLETFCHANQILDLQAQALVLTRDSARFLAKMPHLRNRAALRFMDGDVQTLEPSILDGEGFTHVIHAATASGANPPLGPLEMFDVIVEGTRGVLQIAAQHKSRRFLMVSSGAVYGVQPPELLHLSEEYSGAPDCLDHRSAYGEGKRAAELLCRIYEAERGLNTSIARGFAFVGPHLPLDAHFAIGNFLRDAMNDEPLKISGDGTSLRSYLYAADLAVWLWEILLRGKSGRAYNVGSERAVSILETAQCVARCCNALEIQVAQKPVAGVLPPRYVPSTQRAQSELGLKTVIELEDAVRRTMRWHR